MRVLTLAAFLLMVMTPAFAHPHVYVQAHSEILFDDEQRVVGVRHVWTFDDAFSAFAVQGLDDNGDGQYSREELQELADINVTSLKDFDFFTWMSVGENPLIFDTPNKHWLEYKDKLLTLHFDLPLKQAVASHATEIMLDIYDPEYFVAFSLARNSVELVGAPPRCAVRVDEVKELDDATATILMQIPADQRQLPEELSVFTKDLSNRARLTCS